MPAIVYNLLDTLPKGKAGEMSPNETEATAGTDHQTDRRRPLIFRLHCARPVVQMELKTLGITPRRAMEQVQSCLMWQ